MLNKIGTTENMVEYDDNGIKSYEFKTLAESFNTFESHLKQRLQINDI